MGATGGFSFNLFSTPGWSLQAGHTSLSLRIEICRDKEVWQGWPEKSDQLYNFGTQTVKGKFYS